MCGPRHAPSSGYISPYFSFIAATTVIISLLGFARSGRGAGGLYVALAIGVARSGIWSSGEVLSTGFEPATSSLGTALKVSGEKCESLIVY